MSQSYNDFSKMIDHALLTPTTTVTQMESGCQMAMAYDVASVCIMPYYLARCTEILADSSVLPSTVIGFPLGGHCTATKIAEAQQAIDDGGQELDMVVNISKVLSEDWDYVRKEINEIVQLTHAANRKLKVIFENCYLQDDHKRVLCEICSELNVDWVKTSTGFGTGGATLPDLQLMREHASPEIQVKAAGGIRDVATMRQVRDMGITRIGTSSTQKLMDALREEMQLQPIEWQGPQASEGY